MQNVSSCNVSRNLTRYDVGMPDILMSLFLLSVYSELLASIPLFPQDQPIIFGRSSVFQIERPPITGQWALGIPVEKHRASSWVAVEVDVLALIVNACLGLVSIFKLN